MSQQFKKTKFGAVKVVAICASMVVLGIFVQTGCNSDSLAGSSANSATRQKLVLTGSSTVAPLMEKVGRRFESLHENVRVDVQTGGSSRGISDAKNGVATLGMSSRELKPAEQDGLIAHPIAMDGICMIVHRDNPLADLSTEQIQQIYRGQIDDWNSIGGGQGKIIVINKAEGRGTLEVFLNRMGLEITEIKADLVAGDNQQVIKSINSNPMAIGYASVGAADYEVQNNGLVKILKLDGVAPSIDNIRDGSFKMTRPLLLISKGTPEGLAAELIKFARSADVSDLLKEEYFVSIAQ